MKRIFSIFIVGVLALFFAMPAFGAPAQLKKMTRKITGKWSVRGKMARGGYYYGKVDIRRSFIKRKAPKNSTFYQVVGYFKSKKTKKNLASFNALALFKGKHLKFSFAFRKSGGAVKSLYGIVKKTSKSVWVKANYRLIAGGSAFRGSWKAKKNRKIRGKGIWKRVAKPQLNYAGKWYIKGTLQDSKKTPYTGSVNIRKIGTNVYSLTGSLAMKQGGQKVTFAKIYNKATQQANTLAYNFYVSSSLIYMFYPNIRFIRPPSNPVVGAKVSGSPLAMKGSWGVNQGFTKIQGIEYWSRKPFKLPVPIPIPLPVLKSGLTVSPTSFWVNMMPSIGPVKRKKTVSLGLLFTAVNGIKPVTMRFNSGQTYDVVIYNSTGKELYRWSKGRMFTKNIWSKTLSAREKWSRKEKVSLTIGPGTSYGKGKYTVKFYLTGSVKASAQTSFSISYAY